MQKVPAKKKAKFGKNEAQAMSVIAGASALEEMDAVAHKERSSLSVPTGRELAMSSSGRARIERKHADGTGLGWQA